MHQSDNILSCYQNSRNHIQDTQPCGHLHLKFTFIFIRWRQSLSFSAVNKTVSQDTSRSDIEGLHFTVRLKSSLIIPLNYTQSAVYKKETLQKYKIYK